MPDHSIPPSARPAKPAKRRVDQLLVERDQLEVGLVKHAVAEADEKWKEDLAEYMEEFEQEALLRAKQGLNRS